MRAVRVVVIALKWREGSVLKGRAVRVAVELVVKVVPVAVREASTHQAGIQSATTQFTNMQATATTLITVIIIIIIINIITGVSIILTNIILVAILLYIEKGIRASNTRQGVSSFTLFCKPVVSWKRPCLIIFHCHQKPTGCNLHEAHRKL
jgi:hypothetical protein